MEDNEILDLYWKRSQEAIEQTAKKYSSYCYKIAFNILNNAQDSDECVNDTYFNAWNSMPPNRPNVLSAFLAKITRNLSIDRYRKDQSKKRGSGQFLLALSELEECIASTEDVAKDVEKTVLTEVLNSFLEELTNEKRNVFLRRYWYFLSIKDIANEFNMSEGKIKSMLFHMRQSLKKALEREGFSV